MAKHLIEAQSKMYQEAAKIEKLLRTIRFKHLRILELMNWKLTK